MRVTFFFIAMAVGTTASAAGAGGDDKPAPVPSAPTCTAEDRKDVSWCDIGTLKQLFVGIEDSDVLICVEGSDGCLIRVDHGLQGQALPPNHSVHVAVHWKGTGITNVGIALAGNAGETAPAINTGGLKINNTAQPPADREHVELQSFAPRTTGGAALTVTTTSDKPALLSYTYDFFVPQLYGGALRIGLAMGWVNDLGHSYGTRKVPGADFADVVDNGGAPAAMDLVIGYAPFLFDRHNGGRYYAFGDSTHCRFAPYFALGALSATSSGKIEWLRSVYIGVEYELLPGSSLAVALMGRRVDALANGLQVGMPVADGTALTKTIYEPGVAIVFNFTPFFFQFASSALPKL